MSVGSEAITDRALGGKWDKHAAAIVSVLSFELTVHGEPFAVHDLCS